MIRLYSENTYTNKKKLRTVKRQKCVKEIPQNKLLHKNPCVYEHMKIDFS